MTLHIDPHDDTTFSEGVPPKRLCAWVIDTVAIVIISAPVTLPMLILILPALAIPFVLTIIGFFYRWNTITNASATWGMRAMAIELRTLDGQRLDRSTAFWHTLGTTISFAFSMIQLVSMVFMATTARNQGLTDMALQTRMINKPAL